jgi:hypothetical protein
MAVLVEEAEIADPKSPMYDDCDPATYSSARAW